MNYYNQKRKKEKGFLVGILYGLIPHSFCILFIILTLLGLTTATALLRPFLLNPYFFYFLIIISFVFVTISAVIYLIKNKTLSFQGIKRKRKYLFTLYGVTIGINLLLFMVIFPIVANLDSGMNLSSNYLLTLRVEIPCPGHAFLITEELEKIYGVGGVKYRLPNFFDVNYDPIKTSEEEILLLDVFNIYKAIIINK